MQELLAEIESQPSVLQRFIDAELKAVEDIAREIEDRHVDYVLIAARGSSDNAATYAKYLFSTFNGLPVALAAPSVYTLYHKPPRLRNALVLAISQSGMSPDIVSVVQDAREQGMLTVAITNSSGSRLTEAAARVILCHAGHERSVAATKTYTAQLTALALLSSLLARDSERLDLLGTIPGAVSATLQLRDSIAASAERYRYMRDCVVLARGYNYATANEVALKLKELTYIGANPYSSADFLHGPIAIVEEGFPAILIAPQGDALTDLVDLARRLSDRRAEIIAVSDADEILSVAKTPLRLPQAVPEWLSPITAVIPGQLLAFYLALSKGLDPEHPRGLCKVTETR